MSRTVAGEACCGPRDHGREASVSASSRNERPYEPEGSKLAGAVDDDTTDGPKGGARLRFEDEAEDSPCDTAGGLLGPASAEDFPDSFRATALALLTGGGLGALSSSHSQGGGATPALRCSRAYRRDLEHVLQVGLRPSHLARQE